MKELCKVCGDGYLTKPGGRCPTCHAKAREPVEAGVRIRIEADGVDVDGRPVCFINEDTADDESMAVTSVRVTMYQGDNEVDVLVDIDEETGTPYVMVEGTGRYSVRRVGS